MSNAGILEMLVDQLRVQTNAGRFARLKKNALLSIITQPMVNVCSVTVHCQYQNLNGQIHHTRESLRNQVELRIIDELNSNISPKALYRKFSSYSSEMNKCTRHEKTRHWDHYSAIKAGNSMECEDHCSSQSACFKATWDPEFKAGNHQVNCFLYGTTSTRTTEEDGFTSFTCGKYV